MLAALSITPLGSGDSVGDVVAGCVRIIQNSGLPNETGPMFTTVEGDPEVVFALLQQCIEYAGRHAPRVSVVAKLDYRPGHDDAMQGKVARVKNALAEGRDPS